MIRQIERQYWKFHTAKALVERELRVTREIACRTKRSYLECLKQIALQRYEDASVAIKNYNALKESIFVEAMGRIISGGLECRLTTDDNQIVSDEQLLGFASGTMRKRYSETKKEAEKFCEMYRLLYEEFLK